MAKGQDITLAAKLEIIEAIEKAERTAGKANFTLIAKQLNTNRTTVSRISGIFFNFD